MLTTLQTFESHHLSYWSASCGKMVPLVPPVEQPDVDIPSECLEELRASEKQAVHGLLTGGQTKPCLENLIAVKDFSSVNRLIGVLTCVLKFCSRV